MRLSDKITPELLRIKGELEKLQKLRIKVGIQGDADSEILTIARVHEYGAVIHAKQAKTCVSPSARRATTRAQGTSRTCSLSGRKMGISWA